MLRLRSEDWLPNRLEVGGPQEPLLEFFQAASGSGFVDWRPDWYMSLDHLDYRLARRLRDRFRTLHDLARDAADRNQHSIPLDLNALIPVPAAVLRSGYYPDGRQWCRKNWGTEAPLRKVTFKLEMRRRGDQHVEQVGVFEFLSLDWSPAAAIVFMRERWADLRFALQVRYPEPIKAKNEDEDRKKKKAKAPQPDRRAA
jgi:hypothetical protein